jgi:hypothetical protein
MLFVGLVSEVPLGGVYEGVVGDGHCFGLVQKDAWPGQLKKTPSSLLK